MLWRHQMPKHETFFTIFFLLEYDINWSNFIKRLCLLPNLFSKMYFLFYASAFDDVIKLSKENKKTIFPSFTNALF